MVYDGETARGGCPRESGVQAGVEGGCHRVCTEEGVNMRRFALVSILLMAVLFSARFTVVQSRANSLPDNSTLTQSRLVVFEAFMRPT